MLTEPCHLPLLGSLPSRVVMSAMTRDQADPDRRATPEMAAYYARRAKGGAGLILTEGVIVDPSGDGYRRVPHMRNPAQAASWQPVVKAVQSAGARIFCQLWHCGRISHPEFTGGLPPVSSTNRAAEGINRRNDLPFGVPRALDAEEMPGIYQQFLRSAGLAMDAGFDGVELHLGHGYLADQFLDGRVNDRTDRYGGSIANRCRFALELTEAVLGALGSGRVMVRISPSRDMGGVHDWPDLDAMVAHLIPSFEALGLRLLDVSCARADYFATSGRVIRLIRPLWRHLLVGGASLAPEAAEAELSGGWLDLVTYGRLLIANPDLVARIRDGKPLVPYQTSMLDTLH